MQRKDDSRKGEIEKGKGRGRDGEKKIYIYREKAREREEEVATADRSEISLAKPQSRLPAKFRLHIHRNVRVATSQTTWRPRSNRAAMLHHRVTMELRRGKRDRIPHLAY